MTCHGALPSSLPAGEVPTSVSEPESGKASGGDRQHGPPRVPVEFDPVLDAFEAWADHQTDARALYGGCPTDCRECARTSARFTAALLDLLAQGLAARAVARITDPSGPIAAALRSRLSR